MRNVVVLPPVKGEVKTALLNVPEFKEFATDELIAMARSVPGGTKVHVPDRLTAIVLLVGTAPVHLIGADRRALQQRV